MVHLPLKSSSMARAEERRETWIHRQNGKTSTPGGPDETNSGSGESRCSSRLAHQGRPSLIAGAGIPAPGVAASPGADPHTISPASLPLLQHRTDYTFLGRLLLLEEEHLYALTLHRFAERFLQPLHAPLMLPALFAETAGDIERPLLPYARRALFQTNRHTSVGRRRFTKQRTTYAGIDSSRRRSRSCAGVTITSSLHLSSDSTRQRSTPSPSTAWLHSSNRLQRKNRAP